MSLRQSLEFSRIKSSLGFNPLFSSFTQNAVFSLTKSSFSKRLAQVAQIERGVNEEIHTRQCYDDDFALNIYGCTFEDISTDEGYGGAFYAISDIHTLNCQYTKFFRCSTTASGYVGSRFTPVGGGAFVFVGGFSDCSMCCFMGCNAKSNTQTMHTFILHSGPNKIAHNYYEGNGGEDISSHTLYSLDSGAAEVNGCNHTRNIIEGGYAGGHVGWFAIAAQIMYCDWEYNEGKSIFGSCAYGPGSHTHLSFVEFMHNVATHYGIYMRHTQLTSFSSAIFIYNDGKPLWGNSPVSLHRCYFDSERPRGVFEDEDTVAWNWPDKRTFKIDIEHSCPVAPKQDVTDDS